LGRFSWKEGELRPAPTRKGGNFKAVSIAWANRGYHAPIFYPTKMKTGRCGVKNEFPELVQIAGGKKQHLLLFARKRRPPSQVQAGGLGNGIDAAGSPGRRVGKPALR
jgi:hypothetical protein